MSAVRRLVDVAGRTRSPATMPGFHAGAAPRNKGQRYPADPPIRRSADQIVVVMRQARQARHAARLSGVIVVLWRAGLRIHEALSLMESGLDPRGGSILIKHGKGDRRREVGMDAWAWSAIQPWLAERAKLPVGPLFCVSSARLVAIAGQRALPGGSCIAPRSRQACAGASPRTSSGMPMRSSCCMKGSRCR